MKKILILSILLLFAITYTVSADWHTASFGGSVTVEETPSDYPPEQSNPNPTNSSTNVNTTTQTNVSIYLSDDSGTFNFTIEGSFLSNVDLTDQSNGTYNATISLLNYSTTYYWYVNVTDGYNWTNATYHFETEDEVQINYTWHSSSFGGSVTVTHGIPQLTNVSPTNGSTDEATNITILSINVSDEEYDCFTVTWSTNASAWTETNVSCSNGIFTQVATFASVENTTYWWTVTVNDTDGNWNNQTYHFTTRSYSWGNWSSYWCIGQTSIYDVTLNMDVNIVDVTSVTTHWGETGDPGWIVQDIAADGTIDILDVSGIANHYGENYE